MRTARIALALAAAAVALAPAILPAQAQTATPSLAIDKARVDAALQRMIASDRASGVSALIWQDGREVYFGTAGMADRAANRPMRRDTIAQIYSMTKPVTGVALMQLWEAGKVRLDDPLSKYLPEYASMRVYAGKDDAGQPRYVATERPITVRDVLRHTAGFAYGAGPTPALVAYVAAAPLGLDIDLSEAIRGLAERVPSEVGRREVRLRRPASDSLTRGGRGSDSGIPLIPRHLGNQEPHPAEIRHPGEHHPCADKPRQPHDIRVHEPRE